MDAINDTEYTNGSLANAAAPRFAQKGIGKILFLFKRYASQMYAILFKLTQDSITSKDPAMKAMARRQLAGVFGGASLVAGISGLPFFGIIALAHDLFIQDEDEEDFETGVRKYFGEGMYGGLGNYLFGVDVAGRMGLSDLVFRDRLIEKDQSALWSGFEMLGGPVIGYGLQVERGIDLISDGEYQRGVESMAPAAIRNGLKAVRFATEGANTLRGDPIVEDLHWGHLLAQAFGFAPAAYTQQLQINSTKKKIDRVVTEEKTKLFRQYYKALRDGDRYGLRSLMEDIEDFNERHPLEYIKPSAIKKSMEGHRKTTREMRGGIRIDSKRSATTEAMDEWDDTLTLWDDITG